MSYCEQLCSPAEAELSIIGGELMLMFAEVTQLVLSLSALGSKHVLKKMLSSSTCGFSTNYSSNKETLAGCSQFCGNLPAA